MAAWWDRKTWRQLIVWLPLLPLCGCVGSPTDAPRHSDPATLLEGFDGSFVLYDLRLEESMRLNAFGCSVRLPPCSTFKVPHAMIALDCGVVEDENTAFAWDGTDQPVAAWERDHTLGSAIRTSCVWYFQRVAREVGEERMQRYLTRLGYGNQDISGGLDRFWLTSSLRISANEQVGFLTKLYRGQLPFAPEVVATVQRALVLDEREDVVLSGKTGSGIFENGQGLGWFVGHVRSDRHEHVFALVIRGRRKDAWGPHARTICESILSTLGLWPSEEDLRETEAAPDGDQSSMR